MFKLAKKVLSKVGKTPKKTKEEKAEEASEEEKSSGGANALVELLAGKDVDVPEDRSIMFVGEVTEEKAAELISAMLVLLKQKTKIKNVLMTSRSM